MNSVQRTCQRVSRSVTLSRRWWLVLVGVLVSQLAPRSVWAQEPASVVAPLRLRDVLALARQHRAEIAAARARAVAAAQTPRIVSALPDPMVMLSVDHLPFRLHGVDASLMVQQDFPLSGVLGARRRAARAEAAAVAADAATTALEVEQQAVSAFLMVVELQRMQRLLDEQTALAQQTLGVAKARLQAGENVAADAVRAQLDLDRMSSERQAVGAELRSSSAMLEAALGRPASGGVVSCELATPAHQAPSTAELVALAAHGRPELQAAKSRITRSGAEVDVMRSMYRPMAFVRVGGARTMAEGPGVMVMLGVGVPLWRDRLRGGVDEALSMKAMAEHELRAMTRMVEGEVGAAREALNAALVRWTTARDRLVPLSKQAVSLLVVSYAGGQTPLVSVLDAIRALREARMQEISAEIRVNQAWLRLGRAVGNVELGQ